MDETFVDSNKFEETNTENQENANQEITKRKGRIILRNLTKEQKNTVLTGGIGALAGFAGGAAALFALTHADAFGANAQPVTPVVEPEIVDPLLEDTTNNPVVDSGTETVVVYTEAPFATTVNDSMSFDEAFAAARDEVGGGGIFEWHGNTYGTYYASEWNAMSDADKDQYWSSVHEATSEIADDPIADPDNPIENPITPIVIDESDYIETLDIDGDGSVDLALVDYDGNDMPDVVIDLDGDGKMDELWIDIDPETGAPTEDSIVIDLNNNDPGEVFTTGDDGIASNSGIDVYDDSDLNPDIPIDNNEDMSNYI